MFGATKSLLHDAMVALEAHPGRTIVSVGLLFAVLYVSSHVMFPREHGRIVNGDAIQYYAYLRSLAIDGDLDFSNDYSLIDRPLEPERAAQAAEERRGTRPANFTSIGPALLWAPIFLLVEAVLAVLGWFGLNVRLDGVSPPFTLSIGVAGIAYATAGSYLCFDLARRLWVPALALWATLVAWLGTAAIYYSLVSPMYSHSVSLFAVALFCHTWSRTRGREQDGIWRYVLLGALGGLAALVRWQDIIVLTLPAIELVTAVWTGRRRVGRALLQTVALGLAVLLMLVPQMLAWQAMYGQFIVMPQGPGFMRWTEPAVFSVLFSLNHGLFSWTPVVLIAALGLWPLVRRDPVLGWSAIVILTLAVYVNASVSDWWAGEAFGARRFVGYTAFVVLGLAAFASSFWPARATWVRWSAAGLVTYNLLFFFQYQMFMRGFEELVPYPTTARQVFVDRFAVPWRLVRYWLTSEPGES